MLGMWGSYYNTDFVWLLQTVLATVIDNSLYVDEDFRFCRKFDWPLTIVIFSNLEDLKHLVRSNFLV